MTNALARETSPYLLQHAENPVDWLPWGEEALARARAEDKPILLSVGYSACHWCHVMAHESFEDAATAALMNELFVNVKVDREERPDVDALYMQSVVAMTGHGGWPLTAFLTPEGKPFFGGTYFPPEPRHGLPSFAEILRGVAEAYRDQREDVAASAQQLLDHVAASAQAVPWDDPLDAELLANAVGNLVETFDTQHGGFGGAPKFPPASALELLLRAHLHGDPRALPRVEHTLDAMAAGGMWDVVGGGFHRYSVDARWLVPHFEKMLYDNALLALAYLHAHVVTGAERHRRVVELSLDYILRELRLEGGALASAQDADTDGVEGLTFTWTADELRAAGVDRSDLLQPFEHGRFVLRGTLSEEERARLLAVRAARLQPARDDKAIASWNGLALQALAEAGWRLERADWVEAARGVAEFLLRDLSDADGRLFRTWRNGTTRSSAFLDDYANVARGLVELHVATGELRWLAEARRLALLAVELFADEERGGFYLAPAAGEQLVARTKELDDHPTPSGNAMLAEVLIRLARIYGEHALEERAAGVLRLLGAGMGRMPTAFAHALCVLDLHLAAPRELALAVVDRDSPLARKALAGFDPNAVVAFTRGSGDAAAQEVPLLAGKDLVDGAPALYVCERFACQAPVTSL
jgi:uncharacterized protein YyaL (SSP411 family)